MSIVNGGSRDQLDIICRSTSSRCLIRPAILALFKHYFLQFDLPQYSNCSYGDYVQVNIKPQCLTPSNAKKLDITITSYYQTTTLNMAFTRWWKRMWQSQYSQLCAGRLQSPLWTPLAAVPGVTPPPLPTHTSYPTHLPNLQFLFRSYSSMNSHLFKTQAHIPRWWDGSRKEGFPCQDQCQCGGWGHLQFFLLIFCYAW